MDAVALAATIGGSVVALAGVGATAWGAKQQRESAAELEGSRETHERLLASGARLFEKRSAVYERLVGEVERLAEEVGAAVVAFVTNEESPDDELPERPSDDETRVMTVQLRTFGSKAVADGYENYLKSIDGFWNALVHYGGQLGPEDLPKVGEAQARALAERRAVERLVSDELASL